MNFCRAGILENIQFCYEAINGSCPKIIYSEVLRISTYFFLWTAIIVTVCGNLLVIISITHFKQLHTPTNFLLLSLAIADLLLGGFIMPPSLIRSLESCWYFGELFYRYYAVCHPLRYRETITIYITLKMILTGWVLAAFHGYAMIFLKLNIKGIEDFYYQNFNCVGGCFLIQTATSSLLSSLFFFYVPALIMIAIYIKIFIVARIQARTIQQAAMKNETANEKKKAMLMKRERKAARTLGITIGVFLFCWTPFFICLVSDPFSNYSAPPVMVDVLVWLGYLNSTFNPFIHAFFFTWFRKALRAILHGKVFQSRSSMIRLIED
ncbi:trace amine-associated receptor 1-like [Erpetoichthys calabaricus]|uniref:trace amine-associated receptor 1-like n=1 Tax=Erpetoichthys calabaricus TaxID=27687 RepID=UPI002234597A|nr:trace amine-associated receptor 1-like [Erpetoichthys calabaricus]